MVLFLYYDKWKVSLYEVANLYYFPHIHFTSFDLKSLLFINIFYYGRIISTNLKVSFSNVKCNIQQLVKPPLFNISSGSITAASTYYIGTICSYYVDRGYDSASWESFQVESGTFESPGNITSPGDQYASYGNMKIWVTD